MSNTPIFRIKGEPLDWVNLSFIGSYHVLMAVLTPVYLLGHTPSLSLLLLSFVLSMASLMSITTGYHRLYAHRTYRTRRVVESILLFFGTLATEGSALKWSHDHRLHHRHVDTDKDPYGTPIGFWHSHMLWMFKQPAPWSEQLVNDLRGNRLLGIQDRFYGWWVAVTNIFAVLFVWLLTGDLFGSIVFSLLIRLFLVHHSTWFINSLAHMWGSKPYSTEHSAVNNFILSILTYGEGYHNYHHTFSGDYRNGVRWYQFDPPKYVIWGLNKLGLASDLKKVDKLTIRRRLVAADKKLMLQHLEGIRHFDPDLIAQMIDRIFEPLTNDLVGLKTITERYKKLRMTGSEEVEIMRTNIRDLRKRVSQNMAEWQALVRFVLRLHPQLQLS